MGIFKLHRFNGIEEYHIAEAKIYAIMDSENKIMLWLEIETDKVAIHTAPDTADLNMQPSGEITIFLDNLDLENFGEKVFYLPNGYDPVSRDLLARVYYFEHQEVNRNRLVLTYKGSGQFDVNWRGVTTDIAYQDGNKSDTIIEVFGECTFEDYKEWV